MMQRGPRGDAARLEEGEVLVERPVRRDHRREDRCDDEDQNEDSAQNCGRIANQPMEGLAPQPPGRSLEDELGGFDLGDAHWPDLGQ